MEKQSNFSIRFGFELKFLLILVILLLLSVRLEDKVNDLARVVDVKVTWAEFKENGLDLSDEAYDAALDEAIRSHLGDVFTFYANGDLYVNETKLSPCSDGRCYIYENIEESASGGLVHDYIYSVEKSKGTIVVEEMYYSSSIYGTSKHQLVLELVLG